MEADSANSEETILNFVAADEAATEQASESCQTEPETEMTAYELVADMMRRQDEVILQIDELNSRVETAIKEISEARKLEQEANEREQAAAVGEQSSVSDVSKAA
ncbi:MAG: hypothetical protein AB8B55_07975 [Mariniblastus sp.]